MSSSDLSFFSKSKSSAAHHTQVPREIYVTTRLAWKAQQQQDSLGDSGSTASNSNTHPITPSTSESSNLKPNPNRKPKLATKTKTKTPHAVQRVREKRTRGYSPDADTTSTGSSPPPHTAKRRATSSRASTLDVEPIYRTSRSRSVSAFPPPDTDTDKLSRRQCWTHETGYPGEGFASAAEVVKGLVKRYKAYFRNLDDPSDTSFEPHEDSCPIAELEYPNNNASESFILLAPKDPDHYNPIMCLEQSLYTIIECYLTPAQQALFGKLPRDLLIDDHDTPPSSPLTPPPSLPPESPLTSPDSRMASPPPQQQEPAGVDYLRLIQRAIHRRDGPLFVQTMNTINHLLRSLKYPALPDDPFAPSTPNMLTAHIQTWAPTPAAPDPIPHKVLMRLIDETYQRSVGPHVHRLNRYSAFSSEVYGELMPAFTADIIAATGLNASSLFVDLGSGVGNVIMQASLQTGCRSYGVEVMPAPAEVGRAQLRQFAIRCRMWGVKAGEVEMEEGDMLTSPRVSELLPQADVVLVNNKVFLQSLNEALRPKFLDLKEGAIVVSLKPFVSSLNARVTERNVDDISAIFDVVERPYRSGSVSWGSNGGTYYLHRVDRQGYAGIKQRFENSRARLGRAGSRR
ncbi:S-adenosyl-L-methionine-dependent methyltransferase [Hygrophoropsis aurantiaca]|uniref:S-adenosyl-L-methionine-dependent methyltransferase n=1 Tax=Hygrophoropsis aurantiaca TaxID=72124 RepID=A0ACB8AF56_9AGAM|nr:S-adenosyl-L-methionine-dependent methyltransferase [Hygrophoropsis aurantiaca]